MNSQNKTRNACGFQFPVLITHMTPP